MPSRILIIEDAPANIQTLSTILKERGYNISIATNGRHGLEALERIRPDLILLDIMMPEMDGFETCRRIKASTAWREIPIVFLTAKTDTADIVRGFELGAVDYVAKPFNAHELLARVNTHLTLDYLHRENERLQSRIRELMGHFLTNVFVILCAYALVAGSIAGVVRNINTNILISASLLVGILVPAMLIVIKRGHHSWDFFGLTATNWRPALGEAMAWTLPILVLVLAVKRLIILDPAYSHLSLFSGRMAQNPTHGPYLLQLCIYVALVPVQEFLARGILQGSLQEFLTGPHVVWKAILISNLLFSTLHVHVSPSFALGTFVPGIFWGWLYSRHRTLIGVIVSHILIGAWIFYFVGVNDILL